MENQEILMKIKLMDIPWDKEGIFIDRPNRFLGVVDIGGEIMKVHIHDPGRLKEILYPGNRVLLRYAPSKNRKTSWDLLAGKVESQWVFVHSGFHRKFAEKIFCIPEISPFKDVTELRAEVSYNKSRLDFLITTSNKERIWIEVKGCTLAKNGVALFPDAPTTRGRRHIEELIQLRERGERAAIIVLVFRCDVNCFAPNCETDPEFCRAFSKGIERGIEIYPLMLRYEEGKVFYTHRISVC